MANPPLEGFDFGAQQKMYEDIRNEAGLDTIRPPVDMYFPQEERGIASVAPYTGMEQMLTRQAQAGQGDAYKDFFFEEASRDPSMLDPVRDFLGNILGYDTDSMRGLYEMDQDTQRQLLANEREDKQRRLDDERRERAAMLAAQNQPVDPCPEGYRLDPVSQVCVPTDDTTEPEAGTGRVYETMTLPQENYTPYTGPLNIPSITLPDIFTGN